MWQPQVEPNSVPKYKRRTFHRKDQLNLRHIAVSDRVIRVLLWFRFLDEHRFSLSLYFTYNEKNEKASNILNVTNPAPRKRCLFLRYENIHIPFKLCEMKLCPCQLPFSREKAENKTISEAWHEKMGTCGQNRKCKYIHLLKSLNKEHEKHYQQWWIGHNIIALNAPSWQK